MPGPSGEPRADRRLVQPGGVEERRRDLAASRAIGLSSPAGFTSGNWAVRDVPLEGWRDRRRARAGERSVAVYAHSSLRGVDGDRPWSSSRDAMAGNWLEQLRASGRGRGRSPALGMGARGDLRRRGLRRPATASRPMVRASVAAVVAAGATRSRVSSASWERRLDDEPAVLRRAGGAASGRTFAAATRWARSAPDAGTSVATSVRITVRARGSPIADELGAAR